MSFDDRSGNGGSYKDDKTIDIPPTLPILPVRDFVVFPYMIIPLVVGRESSIRSVEEALSKNRLIFLVSQKDLNEENPNPDSIYTVGTIAMIMRMKKVPDGQIRILIQGVAKGRIKNYAKTTPNFEVAVEKIEDIRTTSPTENEVLMQKAKERIEKIISLGCTGHPAVIYAACLGTMVKRSKS